MTHLRLSIDCIDHADSSRKRIATALIDTNRDSSPKDIRSVNGQFAGAESVVLHSWASLGRTNYFVSGRVGPGRPRIEKIEFSEFIQ